MKKHPAAALGALAVAGALALTGCQSPFGGGGTTTIIQQPPAANSTPASSTPTTTSVTPISDGKQLCHQARVLERRMFTATTPYWKLMVDAQGKSISDPDIAAAADKVSQAAKDVIPQLEGLVGPNAPSEIATAVKDYTEATKAFTDSVSEGADPAEQTQLSSKYGLASTSLDSTCKIQ